jgi:hypothetical protein
MGLLWRCSEEGLSHAGGATDTEANLRSRRIFLFYRARIHVNANLKFARHRCNTVVFAVIVIKYLLYTSFDLGIRLRHFGGVDDNINEVLQFRTSLGCHGNYRAIPFSTAWHVRNYERSYLLVSALIKL